LSSELWDLQSSFYAAGVMNEAQLPEPVHEKAHSRTGGSTISAKVS